MNLKERIYVIVGIIMGMILSTTISYSLASTLINSKDVTYEDNAGLGVNNVQAAIDGTCTKFSNQLTTLQTTILNKMYPVGSLFFSSTNTNPGTLFGGTWVQLTGGFIYASNGFSSGNGTGTSTGLGGNGNTGGTTLTAAQSGLPAHTHTATYSGANFYIRHGQSLGYDTASSGDNTVVERGVGPTWQTAYTVTSHQHSIDRVNIYGTVTVEASQAINASQSHSHTIPAHTHTIPYIGVYVWRRTA